MSPAWLLHVISPFCYIILLQHVAHWFSWACTLTRRSSFFSWILQCTNTAQDCGSHISCSIKTCIVKVVPVQDPMCSSCRTLLEQTIWNIVHKWQMFEFAWVLYTLNLTLPWWYTWVCNMNVLHVICFGVYNECLDVVCSILWCAKWMFVCTM